MRTFYYTNVLRLPVKLAEAIAPNYAKDLTYRVQDFMTKKTYRFSSYTLEGNGGLVCAPPAYFIEKLAKSKYAIAVEFRHGSPNSTTSANVCTYPKQPDLTHAKASASQRILVPKMFNDLKHKAPSRVCLEAQTGCGKCLGENTPILMYDGTIKLVQDVQVGDILMGDDSSPRHVLSICTGSEMLYTVQPTKGDSWVCNESHILSLVATASACGYVKDQVYDVPVTQYLALTKSEKHKLKQYRVPIQFAVDVDLPIDPYYLGVWLGDGTAKIMGKVHLGDAKLEIRRWVEAYANRQGFSYSETRTKCNCYEVNIKDLTARTSTLSRMGKRLNLVSNKHIPHQYKVASRDARLQLLAGLIDTDGSKTKGGYEITQKRKRLADDILFVARSLGFSAYASQKIVKGVTYWRISICGDVHIIPCLTVKKTVEVRRQIKSVLRTGITVTPTGVGTYYGFELDGNGRFVLGDFTVTHNTAMALKLAAMLQARTLVIVDRNSLVKQWVREVETHLGVKTGVIGGGVDTSAGAKVVIATIQTLMRRDLLNHPLTGYDFTVLDEVDALVAEKLSASLRATTSKYWLAMSATFKRKDGLHKVIQHYLGKDLHVGAGDAIPCTVQPVKVTTLAYEQKKKHALLKLMTKNKNRTQRLVNIALKLASKGRRTLIASESVGALEAFGEALRKAGVAERSILRWYNPSKNKAVHADEVQPPHTFMLATYACVLRGVSLEWLDAGINLEPVSNFEQLLGRIRRPQANKAHPIWFYVVDDTIFREGQLTKLNLFLTDNTVDVKPMKDLTV